MRMMVFALCIGVSGFTTSAVATEIVARHMNDPALVGEARLKVLFWKIYDARLYAPKGAFQDNQPFALELTYLRAFSGEEIAERSAKEIREQGFSDEDTLKLWQQQMAMIFPDVEKDSRITGVATSEGNTVFYLENELIGEVKDPLFTQWFFNIWLGEATSEPELRQKLIGSNA